MKCAAAKPGSLSVLTVLMFSAECCHLTAHSGIAWNSPSYLGTVSVIRSNSVLCSFLYFTYYFYYHYWQQIFGIFTPPFFPHRLCFVCLCVFNMMHICKRFTGKFILIVINEALYVKQCSQWNTFKVNFKKTDSIKKLSKSNWLRSSLLWLRAIRLGYIENKCWDENKIKDAIRLIW